MNRRKLLPALGALALLFRPAPAVAAPAVKTEWHPWVGKSGKVEGYVAVNVYQRT